MALDRLSAVSLPARSVKPTFSHIKNAPGNSRGRPRRRARRVHDGRDEHTYGGARRLIVPPDIPPTIACSAHGRARLSQCVTVPCVHTGGRRRDSVRDFRRRRRRSESMTPSTSRWHAPGRAIDRAGVGAFKIKGCQSGTVQRAARRSPTPQRSSSTHKRWRPSAPTTRSAP